MDSPIVSQLTSPYVKQIRDHVVTLITPVVRLTAAIAWLMSTIASREPGANWPPTFTGATTSHTITIATPSPFAQLTRNVLNTFTGWKAQVLHDLHESVPYLYAHTNRRRTL